MGLFKKKRDPITERSRALKAQIDALEAEIAQLTSKVQPSAEPLTPAPPSPPARKAFVAEPVEPEPAAIEPELLTPNSPPPAPPKAAPAKPLPPPPQPGPPPTDPGAPQPKLRSTAIPHGPTIFAQASGPSTAPAKPGVQEPIFEELPQNPFKTPETPPPAPKREPLGVRQYDLRALWERFKQHFRGPPASNPKLVNYLAAGSIQGLRPLRYEKRVARNRFIALVVFLILVLWWLFILFVKR